MKNWRKDRNYRKTVRSDGSTAYVIAADGIDCEVDEWVFTAYPQADRRERYLAEEQRKGRILSIDRLAEDEMQLAYLVDKQEESAESAAIRNLTLNELREALNILNDSEQRLIRQMYFVGLSMREIARMEVVYHRTIVYRHDKILSRLKNILGF